MKAIERRLDRLEDRLAPEGSNQFLIILTDAKQSLALDSSTCVQILRDAGHLDTTGLSCVVDLGYISGWPEAAELEEYIGEHGKLAQFVGKPLYVPGRGSRASVNYVGRAQLIHNLFSVSCSHIASSCRRNSEGRWALVRGSVWQAMSAKRIFTRCWNGTRSVSKFTLTTLLRP